MSKLKPVGLRTYEPLGREEQGRGKTSCFQNSRNLIARTWFENLWNLIARAWRRHWAALSLHEQGRQVRQVIANVLIPNPLFGNIGRAVVPCERVQLAAWSTLTKGEGVSAKNVILPSLQYMKGGKGQDESKNDQVLPSIWSDRIIFWKAKSALFANLSIQVIYHCHTSASKWYLRNSWMWNCHWSPDKKKKEYFYFWSPHRRPT